MSRLKYWSAPDRCESREAASRATGRVPRALILGLAIVSTVVGVGLLSTRVLAANNAEIRRHPGFIDGSGFARLAGEDAELVEVNIGPSLLKAIARGAREDREAASVLSGLLNVSAYIVDLDGDAAAESKATKMIADIVESLDRTGWERLVRVRERNETVNVYVLNGEETIQGLVVLVFNKNDGEVVFANLVGSIDLAKIGELDGALDIPGLDALGDVDAIGHNHPTPPPSKPGGKKGGQPTPREDGGGAGSREDEMGDER